MKKHLTKRLALLAGVSAASVLAACGGGGGGSDTTATGNLKVSLTDAPACGFDNVYVTVSAVRVHKSEDAAESASGWSAIVLSPARRIDLLSLTNGVLEDLGQTTLPVGSYNQMRLVLASNDANPMANAVVSSADGQQKALSTPSAAQSGLKLNGKFEVTEGATTALTLDFDACKSIVRRGSGSFALKPVIRVIPMAVSGGINGRVDPLVAASGSAVVSAQVNGETVRSTVANADGTFSLSPLEAGTYTVVLTGTARATDIVAAVPVTANGTTVLSTAEAPLLTQPSAERTYSGTLSPATAEGAVTAFQNLSAERVAIKYQGTDVTTGAFSMTLPVAAPRYAQYNATLPLAPAPQAALAGKYTVQAYAPSYPAQPFIDLDVSLGNVDRGITLAP